MVPLTRLKHLKLIIYIVIIVIVSLILYRQNVNVSTATTTIITNTKEGEKRNHSTLDIEYEKKILAIEENVLEFLGDDGEPAYLDTLTEIEEGEKSMKKFAMNTVLSDRMPLDRKLKDYRDPGCVDLSYNTYLKASIVIIYHNELLSVVLRTVWSVLLQGPIDAIQEVILVDDYSTTDELKMIDYYLATRLHEYTVRVIHLPERRGLIRARLEGARLASGDILIFLDAHCEATVGWLEPLIDRIATDRHAVLVPIIDVIDAETLAYSTNSEGTFQVGGFTWSGHFTWMDIQRDEDKHQYTHPVRSPTMAGGLFAIDRHYFWSIGSYDNQMDGWGGENLEMSFRVWQCGGRLETVPCSRVGHIFRDFHPYKFPSNKDTHAINTARLALVWMDDYKRLFFMQNPGLEGSSAVGNVSARHQLRKLMRCKSFKWYLKNVYPEKFILDENVQAYGQVRNSKNLCLDDLQLADDKIGPLGLYQCHDHMSMTQFFSLSARGELRKENVCADTVYKTIELAECQHYERRVKIAQKWTHYKDGTLVNAATGKCLSSKGVNPSGGGLFVDHCNSNDTDQIWRFTHYNSTIKRL